MRLRRKLAVCAMAVSAVLLAALLLQAYRKPSGPARPAAPSYSPASSEQALPTYVPVADNTAFVTSSGDMEMRAVWIYYNELNFAGKTAEQAQAQIRGMMGKVRDAHMNTVIVQVRPFSDAYYPSKIFPWSSYLTGAQGQDPGYDPLALMVKCAHDDNLRIQAWVNPLRVSKDSTDFGTLCASNPAAVFHADPVKQDWAVQAANGIYYNPAIPQVRAMIINGVKEIVQGYDVDGVQFDDYFYPTTDPSFDAAAYARYCESAAHPMTLSDWRRTQIDLLVSGVYQSVKSVRSSVVFGISPMANIQGNYQNQYADVSKWCQTKGYVDYICPQIYFGFDCPTQSSRFDILLQKWAALMGKSPVKLYIGLGAYKIGTVESGSKEWITAGDMLAQQVRASRESAHYGGFIVFSYSQLFGGDALHQTEALNLYNLLVRSAPKK